MKKKTPPPGQPHPSADPPGGGGGTNPTRKDGKPKATKATDSEIAKRVDELLRLKLDGAQFHDIVQFASDQGWGVVERQLWVYLKRADALLGERQERRRNALLTFHRSARRALYARAVQAADFRTALAALDSEAKITGLFDDNKKLEKLAGELTAKIAILEAAAHGNGDAKKAFPQDAHPSGG